MHSVLKSDESSFIERLERKFVPSSEGEGGEHGYPRDNEGKAEKRRDGPHRMTLSRTMKSSRMYCSGDEDRIECGHSRVNKRSGGRWPSVNRFP